MATYFLFGINLPNMFDYAEIFKREIIHDYLLPFDGHYITNGPFLQSIRSLVVFTIGLRPTRRAAHCKW